MIWSAILRLSEVRIGDMVLIWLIHQLQLNFAASTLLWGKHGEAHTTGFFLNILNKYST
jgi:hypothetical protein